MEEMEEIEEMEEVEETQTSHKGPRVSIKTQLYESRLKKVTSGHY
jgi:hypothetical protein